MKYFFVVIVETTSWLVFLLPRFRLLNSFKALYLRVFFGSEIVPKVSSLLLMEVCRLVPGS